MKRYKRLLPLCLTLIMLGSLNFEAIAAVDTSMPNGTVEIGTPIDTPLEYNPTPTIIEDFRSPTEGFGSPMTMAIDDVSIIKDTALFTESGVGAHYYAFSGYSNTYTSAFANIKLPTGFNNASGNRNGFISLGIMGSDHGIDLGLINKGYGWYPAYYDVGVLAESYSDYIAPSSATNAIITVKPVSTTVVRLYVQFINSSGANVGTTFEADISVQAGNLVNSNGKIMCRFYRFASLVPLPGYYDNQSDGSYMTGGQITNCQLYNGSSYVSWGISTSRITNAWKVSPEKITVSYTTYNDTFTIQHS